MARLSIGRAFLGSRHAESASNALVKWSYTTRTIPSDGGPVTGDDAVTLLLKCLLSTGLGTNRDPVGTNYDVFESGVGLGIPWQRVNISGFEAIRDAYDFDSDLDAGVWNDSGLFAKETFEKELSRPFGIYLVTGNDGVLQLRRPKNPRKFHVCKRNQTLRVTISGTVYDAKMSVGLYSRSEMSTEVLRALNAVTGGTTFTSATYASSTGLWSITRSGTWDLNGASSDGWATLGYTTTHSSISGGTPVVSDAAVGLFTGRTLTADDVWDVTQRDNRDQQITSVLFMYDWVPGDDNGQSEAYRSQRWYVMAEDVNLGDRLKDHMLVIKTKVLRSGAQPDLLASSYAYHMEPATDSCDSQVIHPSATGSVDDDSGTLLYAAMLLDRYRQPPMMLDARLRWKHNDLEVGDVVSLTYAVPGVVADFELDADTLSDRLFEVTRANANARGGYIDVTLLGHRDPTTPSAVPIVTGVGETT